MTGFGRAGRSDPIALVSIVAGVAAALASAVLWIYRFAPESRILGKYSADVAGGGPLADQLAALAAVLGLMAILASIMTSTKGQGGGGSFIGLVLGIVGLSYPLLTWLNIVSGPLRPTFLD
ncbi:MAG TPA: hypothetical protein VGZ51_09245 [Actinomycetota bacterium]|nr:hypothetical protein [Actinomycetota bacterium]